MDIDATTWLAHAGVGTEPGAPAVPPIVAASFFTSMGPPDPDAVSKREIEIVGS